jgi:HPt (histidine-containing phosphotransfer) domain-containing protein
MIDWQRVQDLKREIGAEVFGEVVPVFLTETDEGVARLKESATAQEMKHALHALKGNALNLGFTELARLCQTLEIRAEAGETDLPLSEVYDLLSRSRISFLANLGDMGNGPLS